MNKWLKWSVIGVVGIVVLGVATLEFGAYLGDRKTQRHIDVAVVAVAVPTDAASVERGHYLFTTRGCADCHGASGAGRAFIDKGDMYVKAPNISPGAGNVVSGYRGEDWVRTIRHGVKPNGQPAFIMPSEDYNRLTDTDLGALIAYMRQLPPASGEGTVVRLPSLVKMLYATGVIRDAAEKIDHSLPPATPVAEDGSVQHGAYVASMCVGCHGAHLSGGKIPGAPPDWPAAANLTPGAGSAMTRYSNADQFVAMLRSGRRPDGSEVSSVMPFSSLRELSDSDAKALYAHLVQLAPMAVGQR